MSKEELKAAIEAIAWPGFVKHKEDEKGSVWEFDTGTQKLKTNETGARLFLECLKEAEKKK